MLHTNNNNNNNNLPHALGLLTTVASLPPKYRSRYLYIKTKYETPLDLTIKPISPIQNLNSNNNNNNNNNNNEQQSDKRTTVTAKEEQTKQQQQQQQYEIDELNTTTITTTTTTTTTNKISATIENGNTMTPPLTPPPPPSPAPTQTEATTPESVTTTNLFKFNKKRKFVKIIDELNNLTNIKVKYAKKDEEEQAEVEFKNENNNITVTPVKSMKVEKMTPPRTHKQNLAALTTTTTTTTTNNSISVTKLNNNKNKATRKLKFDEENSSPVSGTIIRPLEDVTDGTVQYSNGDIDPRYNIVEISEESKAELAAIKNVIGDYICKLCRLKFDDAFGLARHRCACIVLLEYRCPECGKQFNCPANLASHRRWHKPKKDAASNISAKKENQNTINTTTTTTITKTINNSSESAHTCEQCGKKFKRQAYLRKHLSTHNKGSTTPTEKPVHKQVTATAVAIKQEQHLFETYAGSTSSASSVNSFSVQTEATEEDLSYAPSRTEISYDYEHDTLYDCSSRSSTSSSSSYGRLQIIESGLTEEENIAAAALTNLRNCASVIKHTTLAH